MGRAVLRQRLLAQEGTVLNVPENLAKPGHKQQLIDFLKPHLKPHPEANLEVAAKEEPPSFVANLEVAPKEKSAASVANLEVAAKKESAASVEQ